MGCDDVDYHGSQGELPASLEVQRPAFGAGRLSSIP
jgi:hypothetical protein